MSDYNYCIPKWVYDFQTLIVLLPAAGGYFFKEWRNKQDKRKSLATALLAEINAIQTIYKEVDIKEWDKWEHNNIQHIQEDYMTVYNTSCDQISLFKDKDVHEIVTFYTYLKAHIDTIRVLAIDQQENKYCRAIINIAGNINNAQYVLEASGQNLRSTHQYALDNQTRLYERMEDIKITLGKYI